MKMREILENLQNGKISLAGAEVAVKECIRTAGYEEMGYAKLDTARKERSGFAEVIYCQGKPDQFITGIFKKMLDREGEVFGTRASPHQYELVRQEIPDISYDPLSRVLKLEKKGKVRKGLVAVCTGGTSDIPVAEEAAQTAEYFGTKVERLYDMGVSGIHRLLSKEDIIRKANCVIAVAGTEGALASVIGGLQRQNHPSFFPKYFWISHPSLFFDEKRGTVPPLPLEKGRPPPPKTRGSTKKKLRNSATRGAPGANRRFVAF